MRGVILFDPSIRSLNKGDEIIMRSAERELEKAGLLQNSYVIHSATHAPIVTFYQNTRKNPRMKFYDDAKYKFICGSNLLWKNMLKPRPVFNVNLWNCMPYENSILLGVGVGQADNSPNLYTKKLYEKILSKDMVHSTRDKAAAEFLTSLGYKAINTGCPTMWRFTEEFCSDIPKEKADSVVFTLTDYGRENEWDQKLIQILKREYKKVYFWIQGAFDMEYFGSLSQTDGITVIPPTVDEYARILDQEEVDYVGTRLHAGLFAMQHKKRSIIIAIDNRVRDLHAAYDLHVIERHSLEQLPEMVNTSLSTKVNIHSENIRQWLSQFDEGTLYET